MLLSPGSTSVTADRAPKKTVTVSHIQLPHPTRMGWLYDMIGAHGASFEFSEPSRVWIKNRVSNSDVSSRRDRQASVWWQHKQGQPVSISTPPTIKQPPLTRIEPSVPNVSMIHPQIKDAVYAMGPLPGVTTSSSNPTSPAQSSNTLAVSSPSSVASSPQSKGMTSANAPPGYALGAPAASGPSPTHSANNSPRLKSRTTASTEVTLSLEEVLSTGSLRSEFHQHLEEHFQHAHLDFLVAVEKWKDRGFGVRRMTVIPDEETDEEDEDDDEETRATSRTLKQQVKAASNQHQLRLALARKIYAQFMDENKTDTIELRNDIRKRVRMAIGLPDIEIAPTLQEQKYAEAAAAGEGPEGQPQLEEKVVESAEGAPTSTPTSTPQPIINDDALIIEETLFDEAVADVTIYLRDNLWPQFVESEEYQNMCEEKAQEDNDRREELLQQQNAARAAQAAMQQAAAQAQNLAQAPSTPIIQIQVSAAESKTAHQQQQAAAITNVLDARAGVTTLGVNANADADDEDEVMDPTLLQQQQQVIGANTSKPPGWYNTEDYQSIHVDLIEARGVKIEKKKLYCVVNVDSRNLKTKPALGGQWKDHLEFELLVTTQYVEICVFTGGGSFLGLVAAPIAKIYKPIQTEPSWWKVNAGNNDKTNLEILVKFTLHKEAYKDTGHKQIMEAEESSNSTVADFVRNKVSKKKKRFQQDGFDLDMSYVTPRIIAMGYPSESLEGVYRNHMKDVQRFFTRRHPKAYKLYNLCSERSYDIAKFDGSVACYPFDDHNPPAFDVMKAACEDMRLWLAEHPQNVVAIHCKAGKGRTGTMIAAYLCYAGQAPDAEAALQHFAEKRTKNKKGVTIPSQIRYVHYFDKYVRLKRAGLPSPGKTTLFLSGMVIHGTAAKASGMETSIFFVIHQNVKDKFDSYKAGIKPTHDKTKKETKFDLSKKLIPLLDDVRFEFVVKTTLGQQKLFQFWVNSRWIEFSHVDGSENPRLILTKSELDKACKDVKHKNYPADFRLEMIFSATAIAPIKKAELTGQSLPSNVAKHTTPRALSPSSSSAAAAAH